MLQSHVEGKVLEGGDGELTRHDKLVVLQRFLAANKRSPRIRMAVEQALSLRASDDHNNTSRHAAGADLSTESEYAPATARPASPPCPSHPPLSGPNATISERQRRDLAQAAGEARSQQDGGGRPGVEVLTGKKLRKAAAEEVRAATAYDREEENQPLVPSFRDRMKQHQEMQGPAVLSAEYLEDAVARGRFVWPPQNTGPAPNVTDDCERCHRLKLVGSMCARCFVRAIGFFRQGRSADEGACFWGCKDHVDPPWPLRSLRCLGLTRQRCALLPARSRHACAPISTAGGRPRHTGGATRRRSWLARRVWMT